MASIRPYARAPECFDITISLGKGPGGKYVRRTVIVCPASSAHRGTFPDLHARSEKQALALVPTITARLTGTLHVGIPLAEVGNRWLAEVEAGLKPTTATSYRSILRRLADSDLGRTPIGALTAGSIGAHLRALDVTPSTMNRYLNVVRQSLGWAVRNDLLEVNPAREVKLPPQRRAPVEIPTEVDIEQVARRIAETHPWLFVLWALVGQTGLRRGEAVGLQWRHVDLGAGVLTVEQSVDLFRNVGGTKTHQARTVPLTGQACTLLAAWREEQRRDVASATGLDVASSPDWFLFPASDDPTQARNPNTVTHTVARIRKKYGLPRVWTHALRHAVASKMLLSGNDPVTAAGVLGHSNPTVTLNVYGHTDETAKRRAVQSLER